MKASCLLLLALFLIPVAVVSAQVVPEIRFEVLNYEIKSVSFTLIAEPPSEGYVQTVNWSFGDGNVSLNSSLTVFHTYGSFGVYNVSAIECVSITFESGHVSGPFCRDPAYLILQLFPQEPVVDDPLRLNFFRAFLGISLVVWSILVAFSAPDKRKGKVGILFGVMAIFLSTFFFATDAWIWILSKIG